MASHGAPSSSITDKCSYDVFLSFRGEDTRYRFTSYLHHSLHQKGHRVFLDEVLRMGEEITATHLNVIRESRIAIIVFSKNYANSRFCLQELVQILECSKGEARWIYPVFYDVDRSEVQNQTGSYAQALAHMEKNFEVKRDQVEEWRRALSQAATLPGYHVLPKTMYLHECIQSIVERVTALINEREEEEEEEHGDTIHETNNLSFWEKKERIGSYDVFFSYHAANQFDFPSRLRHSLRQEGLSVYVPITNPIIRNEQMTYTLSKALQKSRIAIIVFSKNYADSKYRLEELGKIIECFKGEGRLIYPVFYDVDPSEAMARLEERCIDKRDRVEEWRWALSRPTDLPGYHFLPETMNVDECVGAIVEHVTTWMNEKDKYWVWEKKKRIGCGAHGTVYVARHWKTGAICGAVKELNSYRPDAYEYIRHEINFLSQLEEHPNIVKYYGHKEDGGLISLYMEYIRTGSLEKYISDRGKLHGRLVQNFTAQILFGLVHLHSNRRVHRDLKPANLLVNSKKIVKLVDFGLAKLLEKSSGKHSVGGTPSYAAPEVDGKQNYQRSHEALAADIWSLGCVIIEMSTGSPPPWSTSDSCPLIPEELCQEGKIFLKRCFEIEPAKRPSAEELLEYPFVKAEAVELKNTGLYMDL